MLSLFGATQIFGFIIGLFAGIMIRYFLDIRYLSYKEVPKVLNVFLGGFLIIGCSLFGYAIALKNELVAASEKISSLKSWISDGISNFLGFDVGGAVDFLDKGFGVEDTVQNAVLGSGWAFLSGVQFVRTLCFILAGICIVIVVIMDKVKKGKVSEVDSSNVFSDVASVSPEEKTRPKWIMKTFGIVSIVLWALIGILSGEIILCLFIGLAFIPAKIAQKKGRDFWTWYVYGIWLWLIAFPHALFIKKKETTSAAETQGNEQPVPAN